MKIRRPTPVAGSHAELLLRLRAAQLRLKDEPLPRALLRAHLEPLSASKRGRPGLTSLAYPPHGYRVQPALRLDSIFFETIGKSVEQELIRVESVLTAPLDLPERRRARRLAGQLLGALEDQRLHVSLASTRYVRELRIRITGAIWQLHDELDYLPRSVFTLIPRGFSLTPEELKAFDLARAMEALRAALKRAGSSSANGGSILFLHAEWDDNTGRYQLHVHGWAAGEMVDVVRQLRNQRQFASTAQARIGDTDGVKSRVRVSRQPIVNPAYRLSYNSLQPFWPSRRTGELAEGEDGKRRRYRQRARHRIPEPQHAQHLVWLDQWRVEDLSLLVGISISGGRLHLNSGRDPSTNGVE